MCPNTRTSPHGLVLLFETGREHARIAERTHKGAFWCSEMGEGRGNVPKQQNAPTRACSGVQDGGNMPDLWARSAALDGERTCPNSRMRPCGRILVFENGRGEGTCPNTRTSPQGLVLLFETGRECSRWGEGTRTAERACVGSFWCSRRGGMWVTGQTRNTRPWGAFISCLAAGGQ